MIAIVLALSVVASDAAPAGAIVNARPKLFVLDFRDDGVGGNAVRIIADTLVAHLSKDARIEVASSEDLRRIVDVEAQKRAIGCSDESCLAEIAGALGAQLMIYGTAGKLGELVVVNVNLFDATKAVSIGRETVEVGSLEALPGPLRTAGDKLVAKLGLASTEKPMSPLVIAGGTVAGLGVATAVVGGLVYALNVGKFEDENDFDDKTAAKTLEDGGLGFAIGGAVAALVGVGVLGAGIALE